MTGDVFVFPRSFAQERLAFLNELAPKNPFYNVPFLLRALGPLNAVALEQALREIVRRHEVLRTTFSTVDGLPAQVVAISQNAEISVVDVTSSHGPDREACIRHWTNYELQRPFDLECGPLFRMRLLRLSEQEHLLILVMHHIISDAWSIDVLVRELSGLYETFVHGEVSPLPDLSIQDRKSVV